MKSTFTKALVIAALTSICQITPAFSMVNIDYVTVGYANNLADPFNGRGAVAYAYKIGKYEVTNSQYAEFLNSVDPAGTNTRSLYNNFMGSSARGGIAFTSDSAAGAKYTIRSNMGDKPVNFVNWFDAARFTNWLHNGQGESSTEFGAYTLNIFNSGFPARNPSAKVWIPSDNEWYKAAYYDPTPGAGGGDNYWLYATQSDSVPTLGVADATGVITNPGANVANYASAGGWNSQVGNVTTVGSALANNYFGTADQSGNVTEWTESVDIEYNVRGSSGGNWYYGEDFMRSTALGGINPYSESSDLGFRVATISVPTSTFLTVSRLGLEQSSDPQDWQAVPVTPEMLDSEGRIIPPSGNEETSYRLRISILPEATGGTPPSSATPSGNQRLSLEQANDLEDWQNIALTPAMLDGDGMIQLPAAAVANFYRMRLSTVTAPTIATQPVSVAINSGGSTTLAVAASGEGLSYQWYEGIVGVTDTPVGTGEASFTTPALTTSATYWVRVSNSAGSTDSDAVTVTVTAPVPAGMALIPAGSFTMGRTSGDIDANAPPVSVTVSAFLIAELEVTKALWDEVRTWGLANGYTGLAAGAGKAADHPVQSVTWFDVVKWSNARSEKEGLSPVYTVGGAVMRTGTTVPSVNWAANGYRLPTEAEWEKAARGGASGLRFPWGNTITHAQANYYSISSFAYDSSPTAGYHPTYAPTGNPRSAPVGSFPANGYELHDVTGNVWEWCWDIYGADTYVDGATDPRGAIAGGSRMLRGGSWSDDPNFARVADRNFSITPSFSGTNIGFRVARSVAP